MNWTGKLIIADSVASLRDPQPPTVPNPVRLAIEGGTPNPLVAAKNTLVNNGFVNNEPVLITGGKGSLGSVTVIFMTGAQHGAEVAHALAMAGVSDTELRRMAKKQGGGKKAAAETSATKSTGTKSAAEKPAKKAAKKSGKKISL